MAQGVRGLRQRGTKGNGNLQYWQHHIQGDGASKGLGMIQECCESQSLGGDTWGSPTFAELAYQPEQSTAWRYSDVPRSNGELSEALKHKLAEVDLLDMAVLLKYRGIRTLRALESLETTERAVLLCKSRDFYELLGVFPSHVKNTLNKLFGDVPPQGMCHSNPWALRSGAMPYRPGGPEPLTAPLDDDSLLKRTLGAALLGAREIVGWERYNECLARLRRSDELVVASCLSAAEALAALGIRKEGVIEREHKEALKAAKKAVRDVLLWRCTGLALGLDSLKALVRAFEDACRHTRCDENTISQLSNGYRRVREELAGGPPPKNLIASSPARRTQEGSGSGGGAGSQHGRQLPRTTEGCGESIGEVTRRPASPKIIPGVFDPNGPSSSDQVLPHPDDPADFHEHSGPMLVQPSYACPPGLELDMLHNVEKITERRSLPPARRSPGARSRSGGDSLQVAQLIQMMTAMMNQIEDLKSQVDKLQPRCDSLPFRSVTRHDDDDQDNDR